MDKVNLAQKFNLFQEYWSPKIVGELNDSYIKKERLSTWNGSNESRSRL